MLEAQINPELKPERSVNECILSFINTQHRRIKQKAVHFVCCRSIDLDSSIRLPNYSVPLEFIFEGNVRRKLTFGEAFTGAVICYLSAKNLLVGRKN